MNSPVQPCEKSQVNGADPSTRRARALEHAKCLREVLCAGREVNVSESRLQDLIGRLLPHIKGHADFDLRVTKAIPDLPLDDAGYASSLTVAIGMLLEWDCAEQFPAVSRQLITSYVEAGYFHVDNFDAYMGGMEDHWTPLEKCIRFGCGTAAVALIDLGADLSLVPAPPKAENGQSSKSCGDDVSTESHDQPDLDAFLKEMGAQYPACVAAVHGALMRRVLRDAQSPEHPLGADHAAKCPAESTRRRARL